MSNKRLSFGRFGLRILRPETYAWLARCTVYPSLARIHAMDRCLASLASAGVLGDIVGFWSFCGAETSQAALLNVVSSSYGCANNGAVFEPGLGYRGNGTSAWLNPSLVPSSVGALTASVNGLLAYQYTDVSDANWLALASGGGFNVGIRPRNGTTASIEAGSSTADNVSGVKSGFGLKGFFRSNLSDYVASFDGTEKSITRATTGIATSGLAFLRTGSAGGTYSSNGVSFVVLLGGTTCGNSTKRAALCAALLRYAADVGLEDLRPAPETISWPAPFAPTDLTGVSAGITRVYQQAAPPTAADTASTFAYGPGNYYTSTQFDALVACTNTTIHVEPFVWVPRSNLRPSLGPNTVAPAIWNGSYRCAEEFTSRAKRIAALKAKVAAHCGKAATVGDGTGWQEICSAAGITGVTWTAASASPATYFTAAPTNGASTHRVCTDTVIIPVSGQLLVEMPRATGMTFDFEIADAEPGNSGVNNAYDAGADMVTMFTAIAGWLHAAGYECNVYLNGLASGNASREWYGAAQFQALVGVVDHVTLQTWNGHPEATMQEAIDNQIAVLGASPAWSKIIWVVGIGASPDSMTTTDASVVHANILARGVPSVMFWRNGWVPNGSNGGQGVTAIKTVLGLA